MRFCDACEESRIRAERHYREQQQIAADRRIVEYHQAMYGPSSEDAWADEPEEGEPGYRCPSCGELYDSKCRTARDRVCFQCRYPERD